MNARIFLPLIFLFAINTALALDLQNYPEPFVSGGSFDARIVVGALSPAGDTLAATTMATSLQQLVQGEKLTALLDTEIINPFAENLILVGDCQNTLIAEVKGQSSCYQNLAAGTGVIEVLDYNDVAVLIVGGKDTDGRRKAASALAQYQDLSLKGQSVQVTGTINFPKLDYSGNTVPNQGAAANGNSDNSVHVTTIPQGADQDTSPNASPLCTNDSDCNSTEFCSQYGCLRLECPAGFSSINHTCDREVKQPAKILEDVTPDITLPSAVVPHKLNFFEKLIDWIKSLFS
jgi:hypothetical protein